MFQPITIHWPIECQAEVSRVDQQAWKQQLEGDSKDEEEEEQEGGKKKGQGAGRRKGKGRGKGRGKGKGKGKAKAEEKKQKKTQEKEKKTRGAAKKGQDAEGNQEDLVEKGDGAGNGKGRKRVAKTKGPSAEAGEDDEITTPPPRATQKRSRKSGSGLESGEKQGKKTFARRYRPTTEGGKILWDALLNAFQGVVSVRMAVSSKMEAGDVQNPKLSPLDSKANMAVIS